MGFLVVVMLVVVIVVVVLIVVVVVVVVVLVVLLPTGLQSPADGFNERKELFHPLTYPLCNNTKNIII